MTDQVSTMADSTTDKMSETKPLLNKEPEDEPQGCGSIAICNPKRRLHRYVVLVFICSLSFGKSLPLKISRDSLTGTQQ